MKLIAERRNKKIYKDGNTLVKVFNHELKSLDIIIYGTLEESVA